MARGSGISSSRGSTYGTWPRNRATAATVWRASVPRAAWMARGSTPAAELCAGIGLAANSGTASRACETTTAETADEASRANSLSR